MSELSRSIGLRSYACDAEDALVRHLMISKYTVEGWRRSLRCCGLKEILIQCRLSLLATILYKFETMDEHM